MSLIGGGQAMRQFKKINEAYSEGEWKATRAARNPGVELPFEGAEGRLVELYEYADGSMAWADHDSGVRRRGGGNTYNIWCGLWYGILKKKELTLGRIVLDASGATRSNWGNTEVHYWELQDKVLDTWLDALPKKWNKFSLYSIARDALALPGLDRASKEDVLQAIERSDRWTVGQDKEGRRILRLKQS